MFWFSRFLHLDKLYVKTLFYQLKRNENCCSVAYCTHLMVPGYSWYPHRCRWHYNNNYPKFTIEKDFWVDIV